MTRFIQSVGWLGFCGAVFTFCAIRPVMGEPPASLRAALVRPTLTGTVLGTDNKPVRGATVYLYTAAPLKGTSPFCPSCYPDCQKSAVSDIQGRFRIASLDPNLRFRVLTVAKGFVPTFTAKVTPAKGSVHITLPKRPKTNGLGHVFHGEIIDELGHPVVGARIEPIGTQIGEQGYYGNVSSEGVDPVSVSDSDGAFDLFCDARPNRTLSLLLSGRGLAAQTTPLLPVDTMRHPFKMVTGATVRGGVKGIDGLPLRSVAVGIVQQNREVQTFVGNLDIGTNDSGEFLLTNVTPNQDYILYGTMDTFDKAKQASSGSLFLPTRKIHVGATGSVTEVGILAPRPARRLRGRVVLSDNQPLPPQTRLLISREAAWDSRLVVLSQTGAFETGGIPDEAMELYVTVPGYHIRPTMTGYNKNRQVLLVAAGENRVDDLEIVLEPNKVASSSKEQRL